MQRAAIRVLVFLIAAAMPATSTAVAQGTRATVRLHVHGDDEPIAGASVAAGAASSRTGIDGSASLVLPPGATLLTVTRLGFVPDTIRLILRAAADTLIDVELVPLAEIDIPIVVSSTRIERRLEDEPLRVEVLGGDDVSEKGDMRPVDSRSLLNELSGVQIQTTSPSLGATNIRLEGLPGRYTLILNDGLPLWGTLPSGFGLAEQPPLDLRQAEVIKGAASSLYGPAALGGVVNLISRRPPDTSQVLVNGAQLGGGDLLWFGARRESPQLGFTVLGGLHSHPSADPDADGWTDQPGQRRLELRPRLFLDDSAGRSLMLTVGALSENRAGGRLTTPNPEPGLPGLDSLSTRHLDFGGVGRWPVSPKFSLALRASATTERRRRVVSTGAEDEHQSTLFAETTGSFEWSRQTLVIGASVEGDRYANHAAPRADESSVTPGVFLQHTFAPAPWFASTVNGRCDASSTGGTLCAPRVSLLLRPSEELSIRASGGEGWSAPEAFNDVTAVLGFSRIRSVRPLRPERATSYSLDVSLTRGPFQVSGTLFADRVRRPIGLRPVPGDTTGLADIVNAPGDLRTHGGELFAVYSEEPLLVTAFFSATRSRQLSIVTGRTGEAPFTPREKAGLDVAFEDDESHAYVAAEIFMTGPQTLQDDPRLTVSPAFTTVGLLAAEQFGRVTLFAHAENLTNVRQTHFEPLGRPTPGVGGAWSVDAWGPLLGRQLNAGVRYRL